MTKPRFKTTKNDYKRFKQFVMEAMVGYGLGNWTVTFDHKYMKKSYAETVPDLERETVEFALSTDWWAAKEDEDDEFIQQPITVKNLRSTAKHEVRHLLLQPLVAMLGRYNAEDDEVGHLEHTILNKMERFDEYKPKRKK